MESVRNSFRRCGELFWSFFYWCTNLTSWWCSGNSKVITNSQTCETYDPKIDDVLYVGLAPELEVDGKKIDSIVRYALNEMDLVEPGNNAEETYSKYCNSLLKRLKYFEPYKESVKMESTECRTIIGQMSHLLGSNSIDFKQLINYSAAKADANLRDGVLRPSLFYEFESIVTEFVTLMVSQSGDNLELSPCYMAVRKRLIFVKDFFWTRWKKQYCMHYEQKKFILTKFDIQKICVKLENETHPSEANVNTPLRPEQSPSFGSTSNN